MNEPDELTLDELCFLAGLAGQRRRKRAKELPKMHPRADQSRQDFFAARQSAERSLAFVRGVEDHLIRLIADIDETALREHQQERLAQLERAAA